MMPWEGVRPRMLYNYHHRCGTSSSPLPLFSGASFWALIMFQRMTLEKLRLAPDDEGVLWCVLIS